MTEYRRRSFDHEREIGNQRAETVARCPRFFAVDFDIVAPPYVLVRCCRLMYRFVTRSPLHTSSQSTISCSTVFVGYVSYMLVRIHVPASVRTNEPEREVGERGTTQHTNLPRSEQRPHGVAADQYVGPLGRTREWCRSTTRPQHPRLMLPKSRRRRHYFR